MLSQKGNHFLLIEIIGEINMEKVIECFECGKSFKEGTGISSRALEHEWFCSETCKEHHYLVYDNEKLSEGAIICPYCEYEHTDTWEYMDDDEEFECEGCGRVFEMVRDITVTYSSTPILRELLKMRE